ncbi:MAG TPA: N4-gp56 family major capsid protein [Candidatus Limnocylindria bacterium]|nr:N4-gp56 family major capsid protein [Candidatus Limnocylindria bacterium]
MAETLKENLVIPEVVADLVEHSLGARVTLLPVTTQDDTLQGQPGDTLKFPAFRYIGAAEEVAENGQVTASLLSSSSVSATVKKYAKAVTLTDEARLSGYGDPVGEAAKQLARAIDQAVDDALFAQLDGLSYSRLYPVAALSAGAVADALTLFGDDLEGEKILLTDPAGFAALRKDADYIRASDVGQRMVFSGVVGEVWGCQVVVSYKVKDSAALGEKRYYVLKPGALRLINKSGTQVEAVREAEYMRDTLYASKHCAAYLYDESRAAALTVFTALQALPAGSVATAAGAAGKTRVVIPEHLAPAPAGYKWVYALDTSATKTVTFGTALTGMTDWVSSATDVTAGSNTYAHVALVNAADNKPVKVIHVPVVAG